MANDKNTDAGHIKLFWYFNIAKEIYNFGDQVTLDILKHFWGIEPTYAKPHDCELICTGSILDNFNSPNLNNEVAVWGSGYIREGPKNVNKNLNFYCVRGKLTRDRIGQIKTIPLGDPGLLVNRIYPRSDDSVEKIGILLHYIDAHDKTILRRFANSNRYKIINALSSPKIVAQEISSCSIVYSSSLHGMIFADSFGVPNYWMPLSDKVAGGDYKFRDYCSAVGRQLRLATVSELASHDLVEKAIRDYSPIQNLEQIQERLLDSFPAHLIE